LCGDDPYLYSEELISLLADDMLELSNGKWYMVSLTL
jgi:hypothetical protein